MKRIGWQVYLGLLFVALSALLYLFHYAVFHDAHHIFIYLVGDIAFVPVEVLLVTVVIHQLLNVREKRTMLHKLNMVIGTFFREMGTELLARFAQLDAASERIRNDLVVSEEWTDKTFHEVRTRMRHHRPNIETRAGDMEELRGFLLGKRDFLLRLSTRLSPSCCGRSFTWPTNLPTGQRWRRCRTAIANTLLAIWKGHTATSSTSGLAT